MIIRRALQDQLERAARGFPVITITGPRQSGKTTLVRTHYPEYHYIDLEDPELRRIMEENPRSLLNDPQARYIIDEFQYVPSVLSYVKIMVDNAQIPQQFILTGSNQYQMKTNLSQSLAGRTAVFSLLPFSHREIYADHMPALAEELFKGFYPRLITQEMDPQVFYSSYLSTYLERDIRHISRVHDLGLFHKFLGLCAGRSGCIINKTSLANETGIDLKTVASWLSILQTGYVIHMLQPWHAKLNKRLVKSPKLYFYDTGLMCRLLKIREGRELEQHPLFGQIFETFVVSEYLKSYHNQGLEAPLSFYRDSSGREVDLIIQHGKDLLPVEIKSAMSFHPEFTKNIKEFRRISGSKALGSVVYAGEHDWEYDNIRIKPYYADIR